MNSKALEQAKKAEEAIRELITALEEPVQESAAKNSNKVQLSELKPGDMIKGLEDRRYIVLKHMEEGTLIMSKKFMAEEVEFDPDSPDYKESELKEKIDTEILPLFEQDFGAENLVEHEVSLITVDMQDDFGTCLCKVRPLTFDEARELNELIVDESLPDWYWTCTPWSTKERGYSYSGSVVSPLGYVDWGGCNGYYGVRPVCILKSNIFVSKED